MTRKEFIEYIQELQRYYGQELSETEADIWYNSLKFMSIGRFNYVISEIYKVNKYMPRLSEVLDMHKQIPYTTGTEERKIKGHCEKCNDTGYVVYTKIINGMPYEYAAVCDCGRQNRYDGRTLVDERHKSDFYTPTIDELGLRVKTRMPSNEDIVRSMKKLKDSPIISEDIKNIIRENFRKRVMNK